MLCCGLAMVQAARDLAYRSLSIYDPMAVLWLGLLNSFLAPNGLIQLHTPRSAVVILEVSNRPCIVASNSTSVPCDKGNACESDDQQHFALRKRFRSHIAVLRGRKVQVHYRLCGSAVASNMLNGWHMQHSRYTSRAHEKLPGTCSIYSERRRVKKDTRRHCRLLRSS